MGFLKKILNKPSLDLNEKVEIASVYILDQLIDGDKTVLADRFIEKLGNEYDDIANYLDRKDLRQVAIVVTLEYAYLYLYIIGLDSSKFLNESNWNSFFDSMTQNCLFVLSKGFGIDHNRTKSKFMSRVIEYRGYTESFAKKDDPQHNTLSWQFALRLSNLIVGFEHDFRIIALAVIEMSGFTVTSPEFVESIFT